MQQIFFGENNINLENLMQPSNHKAADIFLLQIFEFLGEEGFKRRHYRKCGTSLQRKKYALNGFKTFPF